MHIHHLHAMSPDVLTAFGVTFAAGLATLIGWLVVVRGNQANPRLLAFGLAFAAGAMIYVSLVEIFVKSQDSFADALAGDRLSYGLATLMLFIGIGLVITLDRLVPNPHGHLEEKGATKGPTPCWRVRACWRRRRLRRTISQRG